MTLASLGMTGHEEPEIWNFNADNHIETGVHIKVVGIVHVLNHMANGKSLFFFTHPLDACLKTMPWQGMKGRKDSQSWSPSSKLVHRFTSPISNLHRKKRITCSIYGYGSKLGTPKLWMVNTKLDISICGPLGLPF